MLYLLNLANFKGRFAQFDETTFDYGSIRNITFGNFDGFKERGDKIKT